MTMLIWILPCLLMITTMTVTVTVTTIILTGYAVRESHYLLDDNWIIQFLLGVNTRFMSSLLRRVSKLL